MIFIASIAFSGRKSKIYVGSCQKRVVKYLTLFNGLIRTDRNN